MRPDQKGDILLPDAYLVGNEFRVNEEVDSTRPRDLKRLGRFNLTAYLEEQAEKRETREEV